MPILCSNKLLNHKADIITMGTKLRYSNNFCGRLIFKSKMAVFLKARLQRYSLKLLKRDTQKKACFIITPIPQPINVTTKTIKLLGIKIRPIDINPKVIRTMMSCKAIFMERSLIICR